MKKMINRTHIEGLLYQHNLESKVTGENSKNPGTQYIRGSIDVATDDALLNIVTIHFTYVTATTGKGSPNATYKVLQDILDGTIKSVMTDGAENATKLRIDSAFALNEFYSDRNGETELVSVKRNEGGFIHVVNALDPDEGKRDEFDIDMVITNTRTMEADEERGLPEKLILKGAIFNFRADLLPVEFSVVNPIAIQYFTGLGISAKEPVFTHLKGHQISETIVKKVKEESAFGEDLIREVKNTRKDCVISWAAKEPYLWDDETTLTAKELTDALAKREIDLASLKARSEEYKNSKVTAAPVQSGFNF